MKLVPSRRRRARGWASSNGSLLCLLVLSHVTETTATLRPSVPAAAFVSSCHFKQKSRFLTFLRDTEDNNTALATQASKNSQQEQTEGSKTWWQDYELKDKELPQLVRPHFPILSTTFSSDEDASASATPLVYLDSAATSQKPTAVTDALTSYYHNTNANVHRGAHRLSREATDAYESARAQVADFIGASSAKEIVFTAGATEAINLVAYTWGRKELNGGDEIVLTVAEHHANLVPWHMLAEEIKQRDGQELRIKYIPLTKDAGGGDVLDFDQLPSLLSSNTKLVSLQHISNVLGTVHDISTLTQMVKAYNADIITLVDACQSVPHQPLSISTQFPNVDFLVASGHKMCGPTGIGFLYGKYDLLNTLPPFQGGGEMIEKVTLQGSTYAPPPGRFEAGTPPIAQAVGLGAACHYLSQNNLTMTRLAAYESELVAYLHRRLQEIPNLRILGPSKAEERASLVAFDVEGVHPSDLSTFLDMEGVAIRAGHHCCQPLHGELGLSHSARASIAFYNTKEEVDYFVEKLEETIAFFTSMGGSGEDGGDGEDAFQGFF